MLRVGGYSPGVPFVEAPDPYVRPPRIRPPKPTEDWAGSVDADGDYGSLRDVRVDSGSLYLDGVVDLDLGGCHLIGTSFADEPGVAVEADHCTFTDVDFSRVRLTILNNVRFEGCKFAGTEIAGATVRDTEFHNCSFRYANLRMSTFERVEFHDSTFDEVDFYESEFDHVSFRDSALRQAVIDKCRFQFVDMRYATELDFTTVTNMAGLLITEDQVISLAYHFALASGVSIDRQLTTG